MPSLTSTKGSLTGAVFELVPPAFSLGRDPGNALLLPNESGASRKHALLFEKDGAWWVEDLGSSNGTSVNGKELEQAAQLQEGDIIAVGIEELQFSASSAKATFEDAPSAEAPVGSGSRAEDLVAGPVATAPAPEAAAAKPAEKAPECSSDVQELVTRMSALTLEIRKEIGKAIVGQVDIVMDMLTAIISRATLSSV